MGLAACAGRETRSAGAAGAPRLDPWKLYSLPGRGVTERVLTSVREQQLRPSAAARTGTNPRRCPLPIARGATCEVLPGSHRRDRSDSPLAGGSGGLLVGQPLRGSASACGQLSTRRISHEEAIRALLDAQNGTGGPVRTSQNSGRVWSHPPSAASPAPPNGTVRGVSDVSGLGECPWLRPSC